MKINSKICMAIVSFLVLAACKKENYAEMDKGDMPLAVTASKNALVLKEKDANNDAVAFTWTTGTNDGTDAAISYTLQLAKQGDNFANAMSEAMGKANYAKAFTTGALNDSLLTHFNATPGAECTLEARVLAAVAGDAAAQTSPVISIKVTPYQPVSKTLYLIGDATPNGWDNAQPTPLTAIASDPGAFRWTGLLNPGEFKFMTTPGEWLPTYNKGTNDNELLLRTDFGQPDEKWKITTAGIYIVDVDIIRMTVSIVKSSQPMDPPYKKLWIVGDATPNGWNIDAPNEMSVDSGNLFMFSFNEVLATGEFKIPTTTGDWGADFYMPAVDHQDLGSTDVQLVKGGSPDLKWKITTPGAYKIRLDLQNTKIEIKPFTPYTQLWLVGDATPVGWNIDNPEPMTVNPANPNEFTWTGTLKPGEFKIPTATGNWGCDYFMPQQNQQGVGSKRAKFVAKGNPDFKWKITEEATYKIVFNQLKETIDIQKQ